MKKDVDYYLSIGCDEKTAAYYASGRKRIVAVTPRTDYILEMDFDNGEKRRLDCNSFFKEGTVFEAIHSKEAFERVYLDETNAVAWDIDPDVDSNEVWNNKIDLCPDSCYMDSVPIVGT